MPIDLEKAVGADLGSLDTTWGPDDVILYNLGLGAGSRPNPTELQYVYEKGLVTLPTYAVISPGALLANIDSVPGFEINHAMLLHGEQEVRLTGPVPTTAEARHTGRIAGIYDKGHAALVVLETETRDTAGELLFTNRYSMFCRGEGGFGGDPGPKSGAATPDGEPDHVFEVPTLAQQAAIYRLSGDKNPLHIDPEYARLGGFDRPILHGLCTFGVVCKTIIDELLNGDVSAVRGYRARFAGVLYSGETLIVEAWEQPTGMAIRASCRERSAPVLTHASIVRS